jgi:superfamily II DNA or RNA helicase
MNFTPRQYQLDLATDLSIKLRDHKRVIACAATGSGKTKTFVYMTHRIISAGKTPVIITEARKIFDQITDEFDNAYEINAKVKEITIYRNSIYIAMAQTLAKRQAIIEQLQALGEDLVLIIDEAHIGTPTKLLKQLMNALMIGFTATPSWIDAKHLTDLYNDIVVGPQPQWLIERGYLAPYRHFARVSAKLGGLIIKNGEYSSESQKEVFEKDEVYKGLFEDIDTFNYHKAMIFCANQNHATRVATVFREMGKNVALVHTGNKSSEMELYNFKNDPGTNICVSVGMLTKGFDHPPTDLIILLRATTSLPLYLQMCGRGSRTAPGKDHFTVLDYGGNAKRFGLWNINRDWKTLWKQKIDHKAWGDLDDMKDCPSCGFICLRHEASCSRCGHTFDDGGKPIKEKNEKTVMLELTLRYNQLRGKRISQLTPYELLLYSDFTADKKKAMTVARTKGQTFLNEFAALAGYKQGYMKYNTPNPHLEYEDAILA